MPELTAAQVRELLPETLKLEGGALGAAIAEQVKEGLAKGLEPFDKRIGAIEERAPAQATQNLAAIMAGLRPPDAARDQQEQRRAVGRAVRLLAASRGSQDQAVSMGEKLFGKDDRAVKALTAGTADQGGFLLSPEYSNEVIELLRPMSVIRSMSPTLFPLSKLVAQIPKQTAGATSSYTGEGLNIQSSQPAFGQLQMVAKKLAALVPISNDLLLFDAGGPQADDIVMGDLAASLAQREDLALIRDDGTALTPKGLRYWAPAGNVLTVNATVNLANVTTDLGKIMLALLNANVRMIRPGWLMAPRTAVYLMTLRDGNGNYAFRDEMLTGRLWTWPFKTTTQIPINLAVTGSNESELYLVDFADAVLAEVSGIQIDASPNAAYFDSSAGAVVSSFSRDETVIRAISRHDFGMRHDASVAVFSDVDWA